MTRMLLSEAREKFSETVNRAGYHQERVILQRNGKDFVAVVPIEDLELLEQLEDEMDRKLARKARKEKSIPWAQVQKELGL